MMDKKDLLKMDIGDVAPFKHWEVTRVPHGWIFRTEGNGGDCAVYVPLINLHGDY